MSNTISGGISFSGIGSGTDFAAMIEQLKEVESFRLYSLEDTRTEATETYDAFSELIDVVNEAKESLELLNSPSKFLTKIASSSNEAMLGVKADAEAVDGTHKIEVKQLASNAIWANKNSYAEKTTVINTTSTAQDFSYSYKGETRTLSVEPGTTLEIFVNMVNSDRSNPGVTMSMVKTGDGYSFQVSGDDSGEDATLQIHTSGLSGLSGAGASWTSSSSVDINEALNAGETVNAYRYTITLNDAAGTTFSTADIAGNASQDEIYRQINLAYQAETGNTDEIATYDENTGVMTVRNLQEIQTTTIPADGSPESTSSASVSPTTSFTMTGNLTDTTYGAPATYTFTNSRNEDVIVSMDKAHTQRDILAELNRLGYTTSATTSNGTTSGTIKGITDLSALTALDASVAPPEPVKSFTVDTSSFGDVISATTQSYNFVNESGVNVSITVEGEHTMQDMLDALEAKGYGSSASVSTLDPNDTVVVVSGLQNIDALTGANASSSLVTQSTMMSLSGDLTQSIAAETTYNFTTETGAAYSFTLAAGHTQQDILDQLDADGFTVTDPVQRDGRTYFSIMGITNVDSLLATDSARLTPPATTTTWPDYTKDIGTNTAVQEGVVPATMTWTFVREDGTSQDVIVNSGQSIAEALAGTGILYSQDADGKITFEGVSEVQGIPGSVSFTGSLSGSDAWHVQAAQDAIFKIDNWPQDITSSTNEVTDVIQGVTMTLRDVGTAQFTVASDTDSVKANIQLTLDAINSVLKKVQDLTAVSSEPSSTYDATGTEVTAAALTGNYSVNLFNSSLKSVAGSNPPGFQPMTADDFFSGDFIANLAQMGIKVSADVDSPDFGLFVIAPEGSTEEIRAMDQELFDDAIANHLDDVIAFFSSAGEGTSSSSNFRYSNHIDGMTEPGTYDVSYSISGGVIGDVYINGVKASASDLSPNTYSVGADAGDAGGMTIVIDNLNDGVYDGTVSIQQGKVNQMIDFFAAELTYVKPLESDPGLSEDNGGLMIAKESYSELIASLDDQITEEMERLERWENTQKLKFARLDTLLGAYDGQMTVLNQQLAQLSS